MTKKQHYKYQLVKFHIKNGFDTYHAVKRVSYEDDIPVSIEEPRYIDYAEGIEFARNEPRLNAEDYGWEDKLH